MKSAKYYYTPAFQLRSFDLICDANGTPLEEPKGVVGTYKKDFPRIAVCSIYDREKKTLSFGHCTCSTRDVFSRKFARKVSHIRAENKPDFVVDVPEGAKVSDITREYTHKIINGEYV